MINLTEAAPPGWEDWVLHRKEEHPGQNPGIWYAIAWRNYNRGETYKGPKEEGKSGKITKRPGPKPKKKKSSKSKAKSKTKPKKKKTKLKSKSLKTLKEMADCACNTASGGGIAGLDDNPPIKKRPKLFKRTGPGSYRRRTSD